MALEQNLVMKKEDSILVVCNSGEIRSTFLEQFLKENGYQKVSHSGINLLLSKESKEGRQGLENLKISDYTIALDERISDNLLMICDLYDIKHPARLIVLDVKTTEQGYQERIMEQIRPYMQG